MDQPSDRIARYLIIFVVLVFFIKVFINSGIFEMKTYKGKGYSVSIPDGWKMMKEDENVQYPEGVEVATLIPKSVDPASQNLDIFISIFSKKMTTPIWVEDEFPGIVASLMQKGFPVMDEGEIKISDRITKWVVYHNKKENALVLEFFMDTDNNMFYKLTYWARPDKFNAHRKEFETLKDSFKLRFSLF